MRNQAKKQFRLVKQKANQANSKDISDPDVHEDISVALKQRGFDEKREKKLIRALDRLIHSIKDHATEHNIQDGYIKTGIYPYSFEKVMHRGIHSWIPEEIDLLRQCKDDLVKIMRTKGYVSDADMDQFDVVNENVKLYQRGSRDELTLNRQRAVVLNSANVVAERLEYLKVREEKGKSREDEKRKRKEREDYKKHVHSLPNLSLKEKKAMLKAKAGERRRETLKMKEKPKRLLEEEENPPQKVPKIIFDDI
jgi:hypothetical protein